MRKLGKIVSATVVMSALLFALPGCQKHEGPAKQAGKKVDNAVDKTGQKIEQAGENIQDAAKGDNK